MGCLLRLPPMGHTIAAGHSTHSMPAWQSLLLMEARAAWVGATTPAGQNLSAKVQMLRRQRHVWLQAGGVPACTEAPCTGPGMWAMWGSQ